MYISSAVYFMLCPSNWHIIRWLSISIHINIYIYIYIYIYVCIIVQFHISAWFLSHRYLYVYLYLYLYLYSASWQQSDEIYRVIHTCYHPIKSLRAVRNLSIVSGLVNWSASCLSVLIGSILISICSTLVLNQWYETAICCVLGVSLGILTNLRHVSLYS